jgi:NAD-binding of NADP-dependent 3-hydroxyisobutyrate dehydrogenase
MPEGKAQADSKAQHTRQYVSISRSLQRRHRASDGVMKPIIILASNSGINPKLVCEVVGNGIAGNYYFRLLADGILENTTSPGGMGQLWKDVSIVVNSAHQLNLPLLVATASSQYFTMAKSLGLENQDSARFIEVLERMVGPA